MELKEILHVIWKRLWLIVLVTVATTAVAFALSTNMEPIYQAEVMLTIDQPSSAPFSYRSILTGENLAVTYSKLLKTRPVLEVASANLGVRISPDRIKDMIGTQLVPETQLLKMTVQDTDPERASDIANEIAFAFISLHNSEQQLQNISMLEQDVVAQMSTLKELIGQNQSALDQMRISPSLLMEEDTNSREASLSAQHTAYAGLLATYLNIQLTQAQFFDVHVAEPAVPPARPIKPNVPLYVLIGGFLGLNFGAGLAFLLEHLDSRFSKSDDVARVLGLPTLGSVPQFRGSERKCLLVTATHPESPVSEAFRKLRTNLRYVSVGEPLKTLLITSAEPAAGKTSVAANLGVVCSQAGLRVIIIDADLRFPKLHGRFGVANHVGLTNLLVGDISTVTGCIIETRIDGLALITGGSVPPNPPDLLDSRGMRELLDEISTNADLVIIDTPPVLAVSDTIILAQEADGVLLVVDARKTRQDAAQHAVQGLQQVGANVFGVVLNAVSVRRGSYYYSYIYHRSKGQKHLRRPRLWERSMAAVEWAFRGKQKVR